MTVGLAQLGYTLFGAGNKPVQLGVTVEKSIFLNFLTNLGSWQSSSTVGGITISNPYPAYLTNDGYPIDGALPFGMFGAFQVSNCPANTTLVVAWQGTIPSGGCAWNLGLPGFTVSLNTSGTVTGGTSLNLSGTNGYAEFSSTAAIGTPTSGNSGSFSYNATAGAFSGFKNLIICRKSDYNKILNANTAQDLINPDWINAVKALNPITIRPLGMNDPNDGNIFTQHRYRKNWKTHVAYGSFPGFVQSTWAGNTIGVNTPNITTANVMNYTCSAATDTPVGSYVLGEVISGQIGSSPNMTISGAVNNGSGAIRVTVTAAGGLTNGQLISIGSSGISGVTGAVGTWTVANISGNSFDLAGSTFGGTYSGGSSGGGTVSFVTSFPVSNAVNNGSGLIRLTVPSIANFVNGDIVSISGIGGVTAANSVNASTGGPYTGTPVPWWVISNVGAGGNTIDLVGSSFSGTYTSGGTVVICQTLNVGGKGTIPIYNSGGGTGGVQTGGPFSVNTFIYDDIINCWIQGGDNTSRCPVEVEIGIANALNCRLWYQFTPHITYKNSAMEGGSNSVTQISSLIASTLKQPAYFEYANEIWNNGGGFSATAWMALVGTYLNIGYGQPNGDYEYYAYRIIKHAPLIRAAWSAQSRTASDCRLVMACQGADGTSNVNNERMQNIGLAPSGTHTGRGNNNYIAYDGGDYTQSPNRVCDIIDTFAYGVYFSGAQLTNFDANWVGKQSGISISSVSISTAGNPGVITYGSAPGYITGDRVNLSGVGFSGGMTQLNNVNVTLNQLSSTTYSMFTDVTLTTPVDTSTFTPYTSGGTSSRYHEVRAIQNAADLYATGIPANINTALAVVDNDIRQGTSNGTFGGATLFAFQDNGSGVYARWESVAASYDTSRASIGKAPLTVELYEGAYEGNAPSTGSCTTLGLPTSYSTSIANLNTGYKNSILFKNTVTQYLNDFFTTVGGSTRPHSTTSVWFLITGNNQWSMYPGDIYITPFQSYNAVLNFV